MGKKGAFWVAMIVWVGYPLIALSLVVLILSRDPEFSFEFWKTKDANAKQTTAANPSGLSEFELKNGIGPIKKELKVGPIDEALAQKGRQYFKMKCTGCHKLGQRYVGPPLRGVVSFRTPTYIMNMILNPHEMVQKHPVARGLLAQYLTVMSPQGVTPEMARAILEYLRWDFEKSMQEK